MESAFKPRSAWSPLTYKEISAEITAYKLKQRWRDVRSKIEKIANPTAELCDAIEAALTTHCQTRRLRQRITT